jgi:hypothetical protein
MPVIGIIHHRGRNTGRRYAAPLGIRPATAGGFVMSLTFDDPADWYRNIVAAGWCVITWRGAAGTALNRPNPALCAARSSYSMIAKAVQDRLIWCASELPRRRWGSAGSR